MIDVNNDCILLFKVSGVKLIHMFINSATIDFGYFSPFQFYLRPTDSSVVFVNLTYTLSTL